MPLTIIHKKKTLTNLQEIKSLQGNFGVDSLLNVVRAICVAVLCRCTVCLEEYEPKDVVRVLPACGHAFHAPCIDAWLRQHPTCPVCRASLRAKPSSGGNRATPTPVDYSVLASASATPAAAAAREAPAASTAASSDITAAASPQADGGHQTDTAAADGRLEIVTEDPASPGDDRSPAAGVAVTVGGGGHSPRGETAGQRESGAGASEHC
jgi:hypothetical protein